MPAQRIDMRKTREIIRLRFQENLSQDKIAQNCNCSQSKVHDRLSRLKVAGLSWPLPGEIDDEQLEEMLYPKPQSGSRSRESGVMLKFLTFYLF